MAGDWIKMRVDLSDDPSVITMSDALNLDEFAVVGRLHRVWSWADQHTKDGRASVTAARIDRIAQCDGFAAQMQHCGWLEITETGITFPAFNRHNGKSAKRRATETSRKKRVRKVSAKCPQSVRMASGQNADQRREEKRREEDSLSNERESVGESPNWLVIEAEFIQRWNQLLGVSKCSTNSLPNSVVNEFQAAWQRPGWWDLADAAMRKFPLKSGTVIGLRKFLEPGVIDDINGGVYDWQRDKRTNTAQRNPAVRHPDDEAEAWIVADDS